MRSYQIQYCVSKAEEERYSDLQVMQSAAGYYIGTVYQEEEFPAPGSRDTNYFQSKELAAKALTILEKSAEAHGYMFPEFIVGDWMEKCKNELNLDVYYRWEP